MQKLLSCLHAHGCGESTAATHFTSALAALCLDDLGFYVSGEAVTQRSRRRDFDLQAHVFPLAASLMAFSEKSGPLSAGVSFPHISCCTLYEDALATLCWFVVPPKHKLPLHDHPCMQVWQRVLYGELHISALDWHGGLPGPRDDVERARRRAAVGDQAVVVFNGSVEGRSGRVEATDITCFNPLKGGGVLHEIYNPHPTVPALFIDIIAPPYYAPPDQWPCTYFDAAHNETRGLDVKTLPVGTEVTLKPRADFQGPTMDPYLYIPPGVA